MRRVAITLSSALSIILLIIALIITWGGKYFYHAFLYGALHVLVPLFYWDVLFWSIGQELKLILIMIFPFFSLQNYLNESLKHLDKSYPNTSLAGLHNPMTDTKPIYIDSKILLGHQHVDNNKNNTSK